MAPTLWQRCLQALRDAIPQKQFSQFVSPLQAEETNESVILFAPNDYVLDGITRESIFEQDNKTLYDIIQEILTGINQGNKIRVSAIKGNKPSTIKSNGANFEGAPPSSSAGTSSSAGALYQTSASGTPMNESLASGARPISGATSSAASSSSSSSSSASAFVSNLNFSFTFDNFVEGKSNQLAKAAAMQVAENPGGAYNPLFLYGGVGLGKTHLMQAVGNTLMERRHTAKGEARVLYLHSERFVGEMVKALQENSINEFKRRYRTLDALLIDDIQFFAGKERSQEEFFHTFNALLEGQQQIILTSDRYPKEINGIEERLKSRFGSGLTVAVQPPELETRVAILMNKALQCNVPLSHEVAFFIAKRIRSNVRELEGALKRVIANAQFTGSQITLEFVQEALKDLLAIQDKLVSIDNIIKTVAEYYKVKVSELLSKRRNRSVARPRQVAMALCKELTNHSLPEIGEAFGGRDHTTVLHACQKIRELKGLEADISEDVSNLMRILST